MKALFLLIVLGLAGCATYSSREVAVMPADGGLIYFMPKRSVVVDVTVGADGAVSDVVLGQTAYYPDTDRPYLLRHHSGPVSKNATEISLTNGLLTTGKATFTSGISDAAKNAAGSAASVLFMPAAPARAGDCAPGAHREILEPLPKVTVFCQVKITISSMSGGTAKAGLAESVFDNKTERDGVYYRLNIPYRVSAEYAGATTISRSELQYSPSLSPTLFVPLPKGFFANTVSDLAFDNGVLNKYNITTDGEVTAALKLPADVLGAYFAAIGKTFEAFKKNDESQADALAAQTKLALAQQKNAACIAAIVGKDAAAVTALGCAQ